MNRFISFNLITEINATSSVGVDGKSVLEKYVNKQLKTFAMSFTGII